MKKLIVIVLIYTLLVFGTTFIKVFERSGNKYDTFEVQQTLDNGFIIAGRSNSFGLDDYDAWLVKTDSLGNEEWSKTYGDSLDDQANEVQLTSDRGYIFVGTTNSYGYGDDDIWLVKTDSLGNEEWSSTFGTIEDDRGYSIKNTIDNGFIISGETYMSAEYKDIYLLKIDSLGNEEWSKTFLEEGDYGQSGYSVIQASDGSYLITGISTPPYHDTNSYVMKVSPSGEKVWFTLIYRSVVSELVQLESGNFMSVGYTWYDIDDHEFELTYFASDSSNGYTTKNRISRIDYNYSFAEGYSIDTTNDGGWILTGCKFTNLNLYNPWLVKVDSTGSIEWDIEYYTYDTYDLFSAYSVKQTNDNGFILAGTTKNEDLFLIKTDENGSTAIEGEQFTINDYILNQNYPNPFNPETTINYSLINNAQVNLKVYDIAGREVCELVNQNQNRGSHQVKFDGSMLTSGIYFYQLIIDGKVFENRKMMLLK